MKIRKYPKLYNYLEEIKMLSLYRFIVYNELNEDATISNIYYLLSNHLAESEEDLKNFFAFNKSRLKNKTFFFIPIGIFVKIHQTALSNIIDDNQDVTEVIGWNLNQGLKAICTDKKYTTVPKGLITFFQISDSEKDLLNNLGEENIIENFQNKHIESTINNFKDIGINTKQPGTNTINGITKVIKGIDHSLQLETLGINISSNYSYSSYKGLRIYLDQDDPLFKDDPSLYIPLCKNLEKQKQIFELTPYYTSGQYTYDLLNVEAFSTKNPKLGKKYQDRINAKVGYAITTYIKNNSHLIPEIKTDFVYKVKISSTFYCGLNILKDRLNSIDQDLFMYLTMENPKVFYDLIKTLKGNKVPVDKTDEKKVLEHQMDLISEVCSKIYLMYEISRGKTRRLLNEIPYAIYDILSNGTKRGLTEEQKQSLLDYLTNKTTSSNPTYSEYKKMMALGPTIPIDNTNKYDFLKLIPYFETIKNNKDYNIQKESELFEVDPNLIDVLEYDPNNIPVGGKNIDIRLERKNGIISRLNTLKAQYKVNRYAIFLELLDTYKASLNLLTNMSNYDITEILELTRRRYRTRLLLANNQATVNELRIEDNTFLEELANIYKSTTSYSKVHAYSYLLYLENNLAHTALDEKEINSAKLLIKHSSYFKKKIDIQKQVGETFEFLKSIIRFIDNGNDRFSKDNIGIISQIYEILVEKGNMNDIARIIQEYCKTKTSLEISRFLTYDLYPAYTSKKDTIDVFAEFVFEQQLCFLIKGDYGIKIIQEFQKEYKRTFGKGIDNITMEEARTFYTKNGYMIKITMDPILNMPILYVLNRDFSFGHCVHMVPEQFPIEFEDGTKLEYNQVPSIIHDYELLTTKNLRKPMEFRATINKTSLEELKKLKKVLETYFPKQSFIDGESKSNEDKKLDDYIELNNPLYQELKELNEIKLQK